MFVTKKNHQEAVATAFWLGLGVGVAAACAVAADLFVAASAGEDARRRLLAEEARRARIAEANLREEIRFERRLRRGF